MATSVEENDVTINIHGTIQAPKKNEMMFNSDMMYNRIIRICLTYLFRHIPRFFMGVVDTSSFSKKKLPPTLVTGNRTRLACYREKTPENQEVHTAKTTGTKNILKPQREYPCENGKMSHTFPYTNVYFE
ncbi:unnamed protein product, partial [Meganyctiphanes norvegica]